MTRPVQVDATILKSRARSAGEPTKGFGLYFDPSKSTSGQRFFCNLCQTLAKQAVPLNERPAAVLFNVSASLKAIARAKWRRQKVLLRIDGLYFDRLSPAFLATLGCGS